MIRELAVIVGFLVLVLPALPRGCSGQDAYPEAHSIRASVRPNPDSTGILVKYNPSLPWVSEYQPPAIYGEWWGQVASCLHLALPTELLPTVKWVQVNSVTFRLPKAFMAAYGFTDAPRNTLYIAQGSVMERATIVHEMAHQLDWWNGVDEGTDYHPPDVFETAGTCGLTTTHA